MILRKEKYKMCYDRLCYSISWYASLIKNCADKENYKVHREQTENSFITQWQSLIGFITLFAGRFQPAARFRRLLINTSCGTLNALHRIHITRAVRRDLEMWLTFLRYDNGV